jgi:hypothetical protein
MKRINQGIFWAIFLILGGIFLLLKNMNVLGTWGEILWAGLFAVAGLAFLIAFLVNVRHWWWAIAAFTLFSLGIPLLLAQFQKFNLGRWQSSSVLFGVALGFWVVLLVSRDNWWAEIPAGVLTLLGLMLGFQGALSEPRQWLAVFTIGLGLVFALLYVIRARENGGWWPAVPAAALILFGLITWIGPLGSGQAVARWWPILMVLAGAAVLVLALQRVPAQAKGGSTFPTKSNRTPELEDTPQPAAGASITRVIPEAEVPAANRKETKPQLDSGTPAGSQTASGEVDIYEFLKNQPPETPKE